MKKILFSSLFALCSFVLIMIMRAFLPKYSGMLLFFFFFLMADGYLWLSVRGKIQKLTKSLSFLATILYWFPIILIFILGGLSFKVSFLDWNIPLRTYLQSFLLSIFAAKFFPIAGLLTSDLLRLGKMILLRFTGKKNAHLQKVPRPTILLKTGWVIGLVIFIIMSAGTLFWQFDFRVHTREIVLKELPKSFNGLKIVQISDVHLGSWGSKQKLQEAMEKINGLHPDVVFFTGDMFNYCTADGYGFEEILKTLQAPYGVYAIMGNHDYGDYISWPSATAKDENFNELVSFYHRLGWKLLLNSHDILRKGNDSIAVIGVENWGATRRFQRRGDISLAQQGTESMTTQLLLSHDPSHWDNRVVKDFPNIDVTFAGHTHGGQVGVDCENLHWSPIQLVYQHWCGLYKKPGPGAPQYLYVNQGLGNIGYSGRIGILPEITMIILKKE
ncbi:MAG: metallophosphoesterase [Bacteroidales bacterium]